MMSPRLSAYIEAVESRMDRYLREHAGVRDGFVSTDLEAVTELLTAIHDEGIAPGPRFCEWGSAMGGVTGVASFTGFDAVGIERQPGLVEEARALAEEHRLDVRYACGTFVPEGCEAITEASDYAWWDGSAPSGYDELEAEPNDFDLVYAYPWPWEESIIDTLFVTTAAPGALLVTNHGASGFRLARKQGDAELALVRWC